MTLALWDIGVQAACTPTDPLPTMPEIPRGSLLVIGGRAPVWRYGLALHRAHGSPAGAVACYDPRLGAVIVQSHSPQYHEGETVEVAWPA